MLTGFPVITAKPAQFIIYRTIITVKRHYNIYMKPVTILLAEDNLVQGLFVKHLLQQAGYRVWFCMNTREAWQYYADKNPDLVLLDDNQASGVNFFLANKIRDVNKVVPILFLSGKTFEEEVYPGTYAPSTPKEVTAVFSEKKLLKYVAEIIPVSAASDKAPPKYDVNTMRLCSAEDILILSAFFEEVMHLREFIPN